MSARVLEWLLGGETAAEPQAVAYVAGGLIGVTVAAAVLIAVFAFSVIPL